MICKECNYNNRDGSLFCRGCLKEIVNPRREPGYVDGNFQTLRIVTLEFLDDNLSIDEYADFLAEFLENIMESVRKMESLEAGPDVEREIEVQEGLTNEGLDLYIEAIDTIESVLDTEGDDVSEEEDGCQ